MCRWPVRLIVTGIVADALLALFEPPLPFEPEPDPPPAPPAPVAPPPDPLGPLPFAPPRFCAFSSAVSALRSASSAANDFEFLLLLLPFAFRQPAGGFCVVSVWAGVVGQVGV